MEVARDRLTKLLGCACVCSVAMQHVLHSTARTSCVSDSLLFSEVLIQPITRFYLEGPFLGSKK